MKESNRRQVVDQLTSRVPNWWYCLSQPPNDGSSFVAERYRKVGNLEVQAYKLLREADG
jgi:hypothetical protein